MQNVDLIINTYAGNARAKKMIPALVEKLGHHYHFLNTTYTHQPGDARKAVERMVERSQTGNDAPLVIVIGGDGTLHDVVNGLQDLGQGRVAIGYIPNGTGNDFARANGIPLEPFTAIAALDAARPQTINVGKAETSEFGTLYFINNFGIGIDARIVYDTNHSSSKAALNKMGLGQLSYTANILRAIATQHPFKATLQVGNDTLHIPNAFLAVFTNHPFLGGGLRLFPDVKRDPNNLSFVLVRREKWRILVPILLAILSGKSMHPKLYHLKAHTFGFATRAQEHIQLDGEELTGPVHGRLTQVTQAIMLPKSD